MAMAHCWCGTGGSPQIIEHVTPLVDAAAIARRKQVAANSKSTHSDIGSGVDDACCTGGVQDRTKAGAGVAVWPACDLLEHQSCGNEQEVRERRTVSDPRTHMLHVFLVHQAYAVPERAEGQCGRGKYR